MDAECIFCRIIDNQVPSTKILETDTVLVIKDIHPKAPIHFQILPKKHITNLRYLSPEDHQLAGDLLFAAQKLAQQLPPPGSFKLLSNNGKEAGQVVMHAHIHFLAGTSFKEIL